MKIVNTFLSHINPSEFYKEKSVVVDLNTLAKAVVGYKVGPNVLSKIEKSCEKLVEYNYRYEVDGTKIAFNLFDNIIIKRDAEHPYAIATFGEVISNAVIHKRLVSVTSTHYDKLKNPLSQIICYALKKEQIANQENRTAEYTYTYFQKIVRFKLKNKIKNIVSIKESLQEFIDNRLVIENYEYINGKFRITFLPLTSFEIEDLTRGKNE